VTEESESSSEEDVVDGEVLETLASQMGAKIKAD